MNRPRFVDRGGRLSSLVVLKGPFMVFADSFTEAEFFFSGYLANFFTCFTVDDFNDDLLGFGVDADLGFVFGTGQTCIV
jgi:hypothetical protein